MDNGKRCFFSEDQTAAEALQNLSRPTPALQSQASNTSGNGNSIPRRTLMPSDNGTERRASDASTRGMSMEARMARIEAMMEALMRDRGLAMTPMGSIEREDNGSDGFRGDAALSVPPLDPINPALAFMGQPSLFSHEPSDSGNSALPGPGPAFNGEPPHLIQVGNKKLPYPSPADYQQYLASFFTDIHLSHPCIDESEFRGRSEHMLASTTIPLQDHQFLALNYSIFACCDILLNVAPIDTGKPKGWRWLELADDLVDKRSLLNGSGDLTLIQCVLFQVSFWTSKAWNMRVDCCRLYTILTQICPVRLTTLSVPLPDSRSSRLCISNLRGQTSQPHKHTSVSAHSGTYSYKTASSR